jgi:hypothetical protein
MDDIREPSHCTNPLRCSMLKICIQNCVLDLICESEKLVYDEHGESLSPPIKGTVSQMDLAFDDKYG